MNVLYSKIENDYSLTVIQLTESLQELINSLDNFEKYKVAFEKLSTDKRRREFLSARVLINNMLNKQVRIEYTESGKPFLANHQGNISISHSKDFLAILYHASKSVGVDIECPTERVLKVSKRFLNIDEQLYFKDDLLKIQLAWSAKEALYKLVGERAVVFSTSMCIQNFVLADQGILSCELLQESMIYRLYYLVTNQYNLVYTIQ